MTPDDRDEFVEGMLGGLSVHDVDAACAGRTRERCRAALAARAAKRRGRVGRLVAPAGRVFASVSWAEPLATLAVSALYLVAAVAASMVLFRLGPPR